MTIYHLGLTYLAISIYSNLIVYLTFHAKSSKLSTLNIVIVILLLFIDIILL